jgi:hypothetical protein
MKGPAPCRGTFGQPALVVLDVATTQISDALGDWIMVGDETGELPQRRLDVGHPTGPQGGSQLRQVVPHRATHRRRHPHPSRLPNSGVG